MELMNFFSCYYSIRAKTDNLMIIMELLFLKNYKNKFILVFIAIY